MKNFLYYNLHFLLTLVIYSCGTQEERKKKIITPPRLSLSGALQRSPAKAIWQWVSEPQTKSTRFRIIEKTSKWTQLTKPTNEYTFDISNMHQSYTLELQASYDGENWSESSLYTIKNLAPRAGRIHTANLTYNLKPFWYFNFNETVTKCKATLDSLKGEWFEVNCQEYFRAQNNLPHGKTTLFFQTKYLSGEWSDIFASETNIVKKNLVRIHSDEKTMVSLTKNPPTPKKVKVDIEIENNLYKNSRVEVHGKGTRKAKRHSFEIRLPRETLLFNSTKTKKFFLLSMAHDKGYINEYLAYSFLQKLNLFFPSFDYVEVEYNGASQGLYLYTERPKDAIRNARNDTEIIIRRKYLRNYEVVYNKKEKHVISQTEYVTVYNSLYKMIKNLSGEKLYSSLKQIMNIDKYMEWLAFNTYIMNGDYTDELYVYGQPITEADVSTPYFDFQAWDYDDLFQGPHDGHGIDNSLIYCNENEIDVAISKDNFLYTRFLEIMHRLLSETITEEVINNIFAKLSNNVLHFFEEGQINLINTNFNKGSDSPFYQLQEIITKRKEKLMNRRLELLIQANKELCQYKRDIVC